MANVVKACVAGLPRASRIRVVPEGVAEITGFRDAGVRDLFEKDLVFRWATIFPAGDGDIGVPARNRICRFFDEAGVTATNVETAAQRVAAHLATEHPWREIATLEEDLTAIGAAYASERRRLIEAQEQGTENARRAVKRREGFSTLTAEQAHDVLRSFASVLADMSPEAIAPTLVALKDAFEVRLRRALEDANATLDGILSTGPRPMIRAVDLRLSNRELTTAADVDALLAEIHEELLAQIQAGDRVRIA